MKEKIQILNVLKYDNDKGKGTRISFYLMNDKAIANNKSYKGFTTNDCFYYDDTTVFDKIPVEIIGKTVDCTLKAIQSVRDPMKSISKIETIYFNGNTIRLLQSE